MSARDLIEGEAALEDDDNEDAYDEYDAEGLGEEPLSKRFEDSSDEEEDEDDDEEAARAVC